MPTLSFVKDIPSLEVKPNTVLMTALLEGGQPVASSCHGKGVCSKCRVQILSGAENLSPESDTEKLLRERNNIPSGFRISCQTKILKKMVSIDTAYW